MDSFGSPFSWEFKINPFMISECDQSGNSKRIPFGIQNESFLSINLRWLAPLCKKPEVSQNFLAQTAKTARDASAKSVWSWWKNVLFRKFVCIQLHISCNLNLIPEADHHFLFYGNASAFITPEPSYRLQHVEVSYSFLHFFSFSVCSSSTLS